MTDLLENRASFSNGPDYAVSTHAEAAAKLLCEVARELRTGKPPEELGERVVLLGQMMARAL